MHNSHDRLLHEGVKLITEQSLSLSVPKVSSTNHRLIVSTDPENI